MSTDFSENYLRYNDQQTKNITIVVEIDGSPDLITNRPLYTKVRYGDKGIHYGDAGLIYGGLRRFDISGATQGVKQLISLDSSSLMLSQKNEPEQGRASVSMLSIAFVDKDEYMTQLISRNTIVPEILGRGVTVYLGYEELSFPEDFLQIFRGKITQVDSLPGLVTLQFSDPNFNRRQTLGCNVKTKTVTPLTPTDTTIFVDDNSLFPEHILGPNGFYDVAGPWNPDGTYNPILTANRDGVRTFLKIDEEIVEYGPLGFGVNQFTGCVRGARGTVADNHSTAADVSAFVSFQDNAMTIALKMMLSGYNGPWKKDGEVYSFVTTFDPILLNQPGAIILPEKYDAKIKYGLVEGDYITIDGGVNDGITGKIVRFGDLFETPNRIIYINQTLTPEFPTASQLEFRSQYDTYPAALGVRLTPLDVDVAEHETIRGDFLSNAENDLRFFYTGADVLKTFLEREVYLPSNTYSLTRRGKLSVGFTKPPLADEELIFLTKDNVLNPDQIRPMRGLNNRKFFNEIDWSFDSDDGGTFRTFFKSLDVDSISTFGVVSILPIPSKGMRTDMGAETIASRRSRFLLSRYKNAATIFSIKTDWATGCKIEAGDILAVKDAGFLQISNFATGERNLGTQLFEVLERGLDIKSGNCQLTLVSDVGADVSDRYAVISPSTVIVSGTTDYLIVQDSYGSKYPGNETRKWKDYLGEHIRIHSEDYTYDEQCTLVSIDPVNNYKMYIADLTNPPMSYANLIIDIANYPDTTSKTEEQLYKQIHCYFGPRVNVVSGSSNTQFDVSALDIGKFFVGALIRVHTEFYTSNSPEVKVAEIIGNTVIVDKDLGFTPNNTYEVTGIGFADKGGAYRYI